MNGVDHISNTFDDLRKGSHAALMPYFTLGFPTVETSIEVLQSIARSGADLIELGIPFSDPLADGPTIQHSTQIALQQGMTVAGCMQIVRTLRQGGVRQPLLLMTYINPILAYGIEHFLLEASRAGADGFIIPDMPPEEAIEIESECRRLQLALVYMLAPTTPDARIEQIASRSTGFIYLVSLSGVTGARTSLAEGLQAFIHRVRAHTNLPLAVGFGISNPEQAEAVGRLADGVIVGSALIHKAGNAADPSLAAASFVSELKNAL
jgi:tryptophan synthase alpha chain